MRTDKPEKQQGDPAERRRATSDTSAPAIIRVLIAEDHTVVRDGLVSIINQQADMRKTSAALNEGQKDFKPCKGGRTGIRNGQRHREYVASDHADDIDLDARGGD